MIDNQANSQDRLFRLRAHIDKWKNAYDLLGHICVFLAVVVGFIGLSISWKAGEQTKRSIDLTQEALTISKEALKIQRDEFYVRNRPYIFIRDVKFSGAATMPSGNHYDHTVNFLMTNASEIPANSMVIEAKAFINNREIRKTVFGPESLSSNIGVISLPPDSHTSGRIGLTQNEYKLTQSTKNYFSIKIRLAYSGILDSIDDNYITYYNVFYNIDEAQFKMTESKYN